jgi:hypothetical protein
VGGIYGLVKGTPRRKSGDLSTMFRARIGLERPTQASLKTVTFRYNGTGLQGLKVVDIQDKQFPSADKQPLWAVENTTMKLFEVTLVWGLVSSKHEPSPTSRSSDRLNSGFPASSNFLFGLRESTWHGFSS